MDFCYYSHSVSASPSLFLHSLLSSLLSCLICSLDFVLSSCLLSSHFSLPPSPSHSLLLFDNETLNFLPAALSLLGTHTHTTRIRRVRQSNCLWQRALRVLITPLPLCVLCETSISIFILDYLLAGLRPGRERGHGPSRGASSGRGSACSGFHSVFDADSVAAGTRIFCRTKLLHWQTQTFY